MKWKVNIRREIKITVALLIVSSLIAFTEGKRDIIICKDVVVEMENIHENYFLDEADVLKLVENSAQGIIGKNIDEVDFKRVEKRIMKDKHILNADLYNDLKGNLIVNVELRRPIARIVREDAPDGYIAEDGAVMSVSEKYTSRVVLVSGSGVKQFMEDEDLYKSDLGKQLMEMIRFINEDRFWKAQIAQLDINSAGKIIIYPQVTGQRVEFGKPENIETKFRKLKIFYKEILPQRGWTKYERINLEYEGQVIAE